MNIRPNMAGGLPAKPYIPPSGPAPPLPAGPPPPQPGYNQPQQDPAAAHAAAWAAYYQSQGLSATGQPQAAPGYNVNHPQPPAPNTSNPYANYGYGAQAAQAHLGQPSQRGSHRGGGGGPQQSYRPPPQQQYQYPIQGPPQHGYQSPTPYAAAPSQQQGYPVAGPQQPAWGHTGPGPGPGPAQHYRPPSGPQFNQPGPPQQPAYFNNGPQQPYTPPHAGAQTPYRPSAASSPLPMSQNRPYQPQSQGRPPRPPMNQGPTPPHHPPAKRPRFDGPGPGPGPPSGPGLGGAPPSGPSGPPTRPSLPVRPGSMPARPPSGPRAPLPAPPIMRPPIHLGTGSAPPVFAPPGGPRGVSGPMRGMSSERGRGRGGMVMNAPRGPSHMRRERNNDHRERDRERSRRVDASPGKRDRKESHNSTANNKKKENVKTTMTDFRIVGIEIKELGWTWGLTGSEAMNQAPPDVKENEKTEVADEKKVIKVESEQEPKGESATPAPQISENGNDTTEAPAEIKEESSLEAVEPSSDIPDVNGQDGGKKEAVEEASAAPADDEEGKVGAKRKAHSPEAEEGSSKKRSTYLLTHGKSNDAPSHESNQNRFRIYFESPPEADRIPQALRRNPYKRWRRASSSVAPSRQGEEAGGEKEKDKDQVKREEKGDVVELPEVVEEDEGAGATAENGEPAQPQEVADAAGTTETEEAPAQEADTVLASEGTTTVEPAAVGTDDAPPLTELTESRAEDASVAQASIESQTTGETAVVPSKDEPVNGTLPEDPAEAETATEQPTADESTLPPATESVEQNTVPATTEQDPAPIPNVTEGAEGEALPAASQPSDATVDPASSAELTVALAKSAENAASAYKSRTRRRSSVSSTDSRDTVHAFQPEVTPSTNRLSILYEGSQRRMCFDAEVVEKIRVYREEGRIEVLFQAQPEDSKGEETDDGGTLLPKGFLLETYDQDEQRFAPVFREKLEELYSADDVTDSIPPLHRQLGSPTPPIEPLSINVYLNKKNPLSLPRWCRTNSADEWLFEQFGVPSKASLASQATWRGKLEVMDPDPPPTLANILENWATSSGVGSLTKRTEFTSSLLSEPYDLLEILLRLARGDRNPSLSTQHGSNGTGSGSGSGSSLTAAMRTDSPYASHQTHVSLAILAMYRLTTDYAAKAGEKSEVVNEKIGDIIKSLPSGMIARSLDGMFKEWDGKGKDKDKK